ncbi:MAG: hypothetical protein IKH27_13230 [Oscillospiraceae bacterium]|nr:hypothetical protein [Oscillospiraceae bacterium]
MKRTKQTALTAAVFAAAIGISSAGSTDFAAAAAIAFSPESQQIAATVYGPPPISAFGDGNGDKNIDARDLTLLKRRLLTQERRTGEPRILHEHYSPNYTAAFNPKAMDFDQNGILNPGDVRELRNRLTGQQEPTAFFVRFLPVPYFSDEVPESDEEKDALLNRASELANESCYNVFITYRGSANPEIPSGQFGMALHSLQAIGFNLDFSAAPDPDNPNRTVGHATLLLQHRAEDDFGQLGILDEIPMPQTQQEGDIRLDLEYVTREILEDGTVKYYDKLEVEYNMLTGEVRIGTPIAQDAEISMPDFGVGWPF